MLANHRQVILAIVLLAIHPAFGQEETLKNLHPSHPRLFVHRGDWGVLRQLIQTDPQLGQWHAILTAQAKGMLSEKPIEHVLIGPRLLDKSRTALRRISTLAALYKLDGDKHFLERAKLEMMTAASFKDWNPSHFLDVAEMTNAMAIGYDWLYDDLSEAERATVRTAIINLGLKQGIQAFDKKTFWTKATHNWSQVCNGGLTIGALAIAQDDPALASDTISRCRVAIKPAMAAYAPDGGFGEGPGYWGYATSYTVYYLAALESALGTDFGLLDSPGFAQTGFYRIQSVGPIGKTFNYADAGEKAGTAPEMFWLSRTFGQPAFREFEIKSAQRSPSIFHLIYSLQAQRGLHAPAEHPISTANLPLDAHFTAVNVAYFRSAWNDPNALFVGIKGGDNRTNHSHLDLGSFVLDAAGHRWAVDLGGDDYNLPGYFGNKRWTYYRLINASHNTLTLDGQNQPADAKAKIIAFSSEKERSHVVIDLTDAYRTEVTKATRGLAMLNRSQILVQDEIDAKEPVSVQWSFLTPAQIEIQGQSATLTQGDAKLRLQILSPKAAMFKAESANPPLPQKQQGNVHDLTIQFAQKVQRTTIAVVITPSDAPAEIPPLTALSAWPTDTK
jgi:hypothetical protein